MSKRLPYSIFVCSLALLLGACAGQQATQKTQANLNHIVLVTLKNDADSGDLIRDCNALLEPIPSVRTYWVGTPLDIGRGPSIDGNYSVGMCIGFDGIPGYREYLAHPKHVELVEKWKPRWSEVRLFDVISNP